LPATLLSMSISRRAAASTFSGTARVSGNAIRVFGGTASWIATRKIAPTVIESGTTAVRGVCALAAAGRKARAMPMRARRAARLIS